MKTYINITKDVLAKYNIKTINSDESDELESVAGKIEKIMGELNERKFHSPEQVNIFFRESLESVASKDVFEKIEALASENAYSDDTEHLREILGKIYSIAHVMVDACKNKHKDWVEKYNLAVDK